MNAKRELYEVYIKHIQTALEHSTFLDYFSVEPDAFHWHMRATIRGEDPVVRFKDGTGAWQPMPRTVGGDDNDSAEYFRACTVEINGTAVRNCSSRLDVSDPEAPAERIYDCTGRQIAHRRYSTQSFAEKRSLPWERMPEYEGTLALDEPPWIVV